MATLTVRINGSGQFTEINAAILAASPGDTIDIGPGVFSENIDLYKGVILQGAGIAQTEIIAANEVNLAKAGCSYTLGTNVINVPAGTTGWKVGRVVTATGIPANTRIASVSPTSVTLTANVTSTRTNQSVSMNRIEGGIRCRASGFIIRDLKVVGYDTSNPAIEEATIYLRTASGIFSAASNFLIERVDLVANGEYALLSDNNAAVSNGVIRDSVISGKTFVGDNPAIGNQFSVPNVPRQLVVLNPLNVNMQFIGNSITGITGGLTIDGIPSFNTAVTIDPAGAIVEDNEVTAQSGYGYGLRVRGADAVVRNNVIYNYGQYTSAGFLITGANAVIEGNEVIEGGLIDVQQASAGQSPTAEMMASLVAELPTIAAHPTLSNTANWWSVSFIFKHTDSSKRLVATFKDFNGQAKLKLKAGMQSGEQYQLIKVIVADVSRNLVVEKRATITNASTYDLTLL